MSGNRNFCVYRRDRPSDRCAGVLMRISKKKFVAVFGGFRIGETADELRKRVAKIKRLEKMLLSEGRLPRGVTRESLRRRLGALRGINLPERRGETD
jgi:hypothetical protein